MEDEKVVLVLSVPRGTEPVYYAHHKPYVRHITQARPANPEEVVDLIRRHLRIATTQEDDDSGESQFLSDVARILIRVGIYADEAEERIVNPWLDQWLSEYENLARELRELSVKEEAETTGISADLSSLADALEKVSRFQFYLGSGDKFQEVVRSASDLAQELKKSRIDSAQLSDSAKKQLRQYLKESARKLESLSTRAHEIAEEGRTAELQAEASQIGMDLRSLLGYSADWPPLSARDKMGEIARDLHLVETRRLSLDGGASVRAVVDKVQEINSALEEIIEGINP